MARFIVYEDKLRDNLKLIKHVATEADVDIIMALKANALWKTFPIIAEYIPNSTASSLNELQLSNDYLRGKVHSYCPVYTPETFPQFLQGSSHITFNSLSQLERYLPEIQSHNIAHPDKRVSPGLRVNPECSIVETDIYNPCIAGSRFGVKASQLGKEVPAGLEGLHFHALCESDSHQLEKVLNAFEEQFGHLLPHIKWVNMGGGHLMTRKDYDTEHLIRLLKDFKKRHPNLRLIMEPGSAFTWQTGDLETTVLDIVESDGVKTAIIDASFACHMPDTLEMPYKPYIAEALPDDYEGPCHVYRLGGNSCLSGDWKGDWKFAEPLQPGEKLTLLDMNHYTTVKTNMFNGIQHPDIWLRHSDGKEELLRRFTYADYRSRMS